MRIDSESPTPGLTRRDAWPRQSPVIALPLFRPLVWPWDLRPPDRYSGICSDADAFRQGLQRSFGGIPTPSMTTITGASCRSVRILIS